MYYAGMDIHKLFSQIAVIDETGRVVERHRMNHRPKEKLCDYFNQFPKDTPLAIGSLTLKLRSRMVDPSSLSC